MIPAISVYDASLCENDVLVGTCRFNLRRNRISCTFSYADSYLAMPQAYEIEPAAPLRSAAYHFDGIPGALRDSAPDRWGRHLINRKNISAAQSKGDFPRTLDEVDYLLGVYDASRQGSLRYSIPNEGERLSPHEEIPPLVELKRLIAASNGVARGDDGRDNVKELLDAGSGSLGGARPKASVVDSGKLYLAKFSHPGDEWNVMAWEKTALDIAAAARIKVPERKIIHIGADSALLLERFDRDGSKMTGRRIPYLSAMSLVGAHDGEKLDYVDVADELAVWTANPKRQLLELFKRVALSVVLHNTDDHLRNLGFVRVSGEWVVAPAFDININPDLKRERATSIYGEAGVGEVSALKDFAVMCGLSKTESFDAIKLTVQAARGWRGFAQRNGCKETEMSLLGKAVDNRCRALAEEFNL